MLERFIIAIIGSPFGLDGFVKIRSLSGEVDHLLDLTEVTISKDGKEQILKIEEVKESPLAMRFKGIDTPEKAKPLSGAEIIVDREQAVPLNEGEYYIEDLKGLSVITKDGEQIGHIIDIIEGGGGELAEINVQCIMHNAQFEESEKSGKNLKLVPFRKEFFPEIDIEKGIIIMDNLWILE